MTTITAADRINLNFRLTMCAWSAKITNAHGGIAQLGERLNGIQEVSGSIPLISTKQIRLESVNFRVFFFGAVVREYLTARRVRCIVNKRNVINLPHTFSRSPMKTQTIHSCFQLRIFITIIADPANNQPLAMKYNNTLYYYVLNAQGDVVRIVNSSRSVVASYTYDPWGKIISSSGTLADINPLRYCGYYYDSETGFYYLQSRYYDPEIGRFINADSYASTDATGLLSTNMFAYCENDPVNRSDPSGDVYLEVLLTGAAIGIFKQFAADVIGNAIAGRPLDQLSSVGTYAAAAVSGMTEMMPGGGLMATAVDILFSPIIQETIDVAVYGREADYKGTAIGIGKNGISNGASTWLSKSADQIAQAAKKQSGVKKKLGQISAKVVRTVGKHISSIISVLEKALR